MFICFFGTQKRKKYTYEDMIIKSTNKPMKICKLKRIIKDMFICKN